MNWGIWGRKWGFKLAYTAASGAIAVAISASTDLAHRPDAPVWAGVIALAINTAATQLGNLLNHTVLAKQ